MKYIDMRPARQPGKRSLFRNQLDSLPGPRPAKLFEPFLRSNGSRGASTDTGTGGMLLDVWKTVWRRKVTLASIAGVAAALGVMATFLQTPVYQVRASLEFQDLNQEFLNIKQVLPIGESANYSALTDIQTQIKILQSDRLLDRTIASLRSRGSKRAALPQAAEDAQHNLTVQTAGQTRIVEALFNSPDPAYAADFANRLLNEFIEQNLAARWEMSQRTVNWLERQLAEARTAAPATPASFTRCNMPS